jgi:hypothetical protein
VAVRCVLGVVALVAAVACMAGCGAVSSGAVGSRGQSAAVVAQHLLDAIDHHDGSAACALLAPETSAEVAQSAEKDCADAIVEQQLPKPGSIMGTDVDGQWARVVLSDDTMFLAMFPGGWRVVAAGCTGRGDRPYDCIVQGG